MTYSSEVLADSPSAYYRLGESSGTTMVDSSGNGRNGAYTGSVTLGATGLLVGDSDTALSLAGGGDGTVTYDSAWLSAVEFTVEVWFKASTVSATQNIVSRYESTFGASRWTLRLDGSTLNLYAFNGGSFNTATIATGITAGSVHHVVLAYDMSGTPTYRPYFDGVAKTPSAQGSNIVGTNLYIGRAHGTEAFNGTIDEVAYYPTVLSATRVAAHYAAGSSTAVTVAGAAFSVGATMLDGAARTAIRVSGAAFSSAATMLAGQPNLPVTIAGEPFSAGVVMVDGTAAAAILVSGSAFAVVPTFLPGQVVGAAISGEPFVVGASFLDGVRLFGTDTSNAEGGLSLVGRATVTLTRPVAAPPSTLPPRYDKAVPYPVPVLVDGRPT